MGAFDTYSTSDACPRCGAPLFVSDQTKFFAPDFANVYGRSFEPGVPQPLTVEVADILAASIWEEDWWRVREARQDDDLAVLGALDDDLPWCNQCGAPLVTVLHFRLIAGTPSAALKEKWTQHHVWCPPECLRGAVELVRLHLFDVERSDPAPLVDFAQVEAVVPPPCENWSAAAERLASAPVDQRVEMLRRAIREQRCPR